MKLGLTLLNQILGIGLALALSPLFIVKYGIDGYAQISLWVSLIAIFAYFDFGLSQVITKRYIDYDIQRFSNLYKVYRRLIWVGAAIATVVVFGFYYYSSEMVEIFGATTLVGVVCFGLGMRLVQQIPRSQLLAAGKVAHVSIFQIIANIVRFFLPLIFFDYISYFFFLSAFIALIELLWLEAYAARLRLEKLRSYRVEVDQVESKRGLSIGEDLRFSASLGLLTLGWLLTSQLDKFLALKSMELEMYASYSLVSNFFFLSVVLLNPIRQAFSHALFGAEKMSVVAAVDSIAIIFSTCIVGFLLIVSDEIIATYLDVTLDKRITSILSAYVFLICFTFKYHLVQYVHGRMRLQNILQIADILIIPVIAIYFDFRIVESMSAAVIYKVIVTIFLEYRVFIEFGYRTSIPRFIKDIATASPIVVCGFIHNEFGLQAMAVSLVIAFTVTLYMVLQRNLLEFS